MPVPPSSRSRADDGALNAATGASAPQRASSPTPGGAQERAASPEGAQERATAAAEATASTPGPGARSPVITPADELAVLELVGVAQAGPTPATPAAPQAPQGKRVVPPRGAAADFDREGRRRCAARVLAGAYGYLRVPEAVAALKRCSDDYASAVSWADEEQNSRRKPGMQGKSAASLQTLVADMTAAAAAHEPAKATDPAPAPADE